MWWAGPQASARQRILPQPDEGSLWLTITLPPGSSLKHTKDVERVVRIGLSMAELDNAVRTALGAAMSVASTKTNAVSI